MSRTVFCRKYQKEMPGLATAPYPGARGQDIFQNVSQQAWQEWQQQQTMLINEKQLSMMNPEHRGYLQGQMDMFLNDEVYDAVGRYSPAAFLRVLFPGLLTRKACPGLIRALPKLAAVPPQAQVAQSVEQRIENPRVGGSIPPLGTIPMKPNTQNSGYLVAIK